MMRRISANWGGALALAAILALGTALPGPSDTQAAQDVASDRKAAIKSASTQLARDTADCHQLHGPDAQILMLDGMHLVCRAAAQRTHHTTTAQVQP